MEKQYEQAIAEASGRLRLIPTMPMGMVAGEHLQLVRDDRKNPLRWWSRRYASILITPPCTYSIWACVLSDGTL